MHKITFFFTKKGPMRFISHLDLMRLFMRALRRAQIPVKISEGFNPHPKLSLPKALKLGKESDNEEAAITVYRDIAPEEFIVRLNEQLPRGVRIVKAAVQEERRLNG